ncbi:efflux RND transporter permease subunit [Verrucomicrobia bacterium]|nr:efflux RND transporter permease subunit [Verrucomicrobiota bacterium]
MNGIIDWFARNSVAANLLVVGIVVAGFTGLRNATREVFPTVSTDMISVSVAYLGAAPAEVEQGVCIKIEEAIESVEGIKKITSSAAEGMGTVRAELLPRTNMSAALDEIKAAVGAIDTFPELAEKPLIEEVFIEKQVINVAIAGELDAFSLRGMAERVRDELVSMEGITKVRLANARPYEISIEVSETSLRKYGLTFDAVALAVRRSSMDLPGGIVKTDGGEIRLRAKGQSYNGAEFENIVISSRSDGTRLLLKDVAKVVDGFMEMDQEAFFDGKPAVLVQVFRTGNQNALEISATVRTYVEEQRSRLPEGLLMTTWQDDASYLQSRQDLLVKNGFYGLTLVFATLALFLRLGLAGWVSFGLFISFLGTLWLMPIMDVSINLLSLFAFILVLGIVVDDAIVVSENIHAHQEKHEHSLQASIQGAQEVSKPVIFAVLTTVAAFLPLLTVPGNTGKIMRVIPMIVIPTLLFSLIESLFVLPSHLSHKISNEDGGMDDPNTRTRGLRSAWHRFQKSFGKRLDHFVKVFYTPCLQQALHWRYLTLSVAISVFLVTIGLVGGGWIRFQFFPPVEGDNVAAILTMPHGTPVQSTREAIRTLQESAIQLQMEVDANRDEEQGSVFRHVLASVGQQPYYKSQQEGAGKFIPNVSSPHLGEVHVELTASELREGTSSYALANRWRDGTDLIPGSEELTFTASIFSSGEPINVQLTGTDFGMLRQAASLLKEYLGAYPGVRDISDSFRLGKREIKMFIKPEAEATGLTQMDLARQVRQAFYGEEAQRIQRGRDEVRVMVRYPETERRSIVSLEKMRVRLPDGTEVPFEEVAMVERGRGYSTIQRVDRRRSINVVAEVDASQANTTEIINDLDARFLPQLVEKFPNLQYTWEGERREQQETILGIMKGYPLALVIIYSLLAIPFRSYLQPLIVMSAIPFGLVGAVWGHIIMNLDLTILSMFGIVALSGVVVNDNLVLVVFINRQRERGKSLVEAVQMAGASRFRPILLTSLTTFVGLMPLILEKSVQAQFLVPMAISLAFGVMFATVISLLLVPAIYLILEDLIGLFARLFIKKHPVQ